MDEVGGGALVLGASSGLHGYDPDTPTSDRGYKVSVAPSSADLYERNTIRREPIGIERDVPVHGVREIPALLWKSDQSSRERDSSYAVGRGMAVNCCRGTMEGPGTKNDDTRHPGIRAPVSGDVRLLEEDPR